MQRRFERRRRLALALLAVAALTVAAPACVRTSWPHTSGRYVGTTVSDARFARLRRGVNLSHWFAQLAPDSARVDVTSGDVTRADLEKIRALGFGHVRFGVDPEPMYDERDPSHIDGPYLASLDRAVDAILNADLAVVIAMHPTEGGSFKKRLEDDDAHVARVARFWEALARHFAARDPDRLFLEVLNENEVGDRGRWEEVQNKLLAAMRRGAPRHTLIATGARWGRAKDLTHLEPVADRNVVYDFHFYEPYEFTHQGATWAVRYWQYLRSIPYPSSVDLVAPAIEGIGSSQARVVAFRYGSQHWNAGRLGERLSDVGDWARTHGVRVMCGEFGVLRTAPAAGRAAWLHDTRTLLEREGFGWSVWDYSSPTFGIVDARSGVRRAPDVRVMGALGMIR